MLGGPADDGALRERHRQVERDSEQGGDEDARPGCLEVQDLRLRANEHPECVVGPPKYSPTTAPIIASTLATFSAVKMKGRAVGKRTRRQIVRSLAAYERISSIWRGETLVSPRRVLTITGKKQRTPAIAIFELRESGSNHALKIGAKAMIGIALAAIAIGISALPSVRKRPISVATTMPPSEPSAKPPSASSNVYQPAGQSVCRWSQNALTIDVGFGSRNCWMWNAAIAPCQTTIPSTKTTIAGTHSRAWRPMLPGVIVYELTPESAASSSGRRCSPRLRRSSRTSVTSAKYRGSSRVSTVRG